MRATRKPGEFLVSRVQAGLTHPFLAQQFDRGQDLLVFSPLAVVGLDVGPSDLPRLVDQEVGAV